MNSLFNFLDANREALTAGACVFCVGTLCLGIVLFVVYSLEQTFDSMDGVRE